MDVSKFGLIYAGAQKNVGPAGITIVIVRDDLIGQAAKGTPSVMDYKAQADADSMLNTPPTYSIYIAGLVFKWLKQQGGLAGDREKNIEKAKLLYDFLDSSSRSSRNPVAKEDRSRMNVPFTLKDSSLDEAFLKGAAAKRHGATERPPLGRRHARLDLQRHAARGRAAPRRLHEGLRERSMVKAKKCEVLVINNIAQVGLKRFPAERYAVVKESKDPWAILVRLAGPAPVHEFGPSLRAVGRAGAGVNNIPVAVLSKRGIPVFNAPGANANAVKELVLAGMLIAARNLGPALEFVRQTEKTTNLDKTVEDGKKQFAGFELPGHTLGVIGLGKIGSLVADAAIRLGMNVLGYDPHITVEAAWSLPSQVKRATSVDEILKASHFVTLHVPLVEKTRHLDQREEPRADAPRRGAAQLLARRRRRRRRRC